MTNGRLPNRLKILQTVKTPLAFFVLALLVLEAAFTVVSARSSDITHIFLWNIVAIVIVTAIVALLQFFGVLDGHEKQQISYYSVFIEAPDDLPGLDLNRIVWDEGNCAVRIKNKAYPAVPTSPSDAQGAALEVRITSDIFPSDEHAPVDLILTDDKGNRWDVRRFRLWQRNLKLRVRSDRDKIINDYAEGGNQ